ncbi:uncharacterized protein LOC111323040 isoform X3 [Stylophora pistillata]|nr:uncharacterized protein LOC111323040 isoform X3 [Stylophora pistillata]
MSELINQVNKLRENVTANPSCDQSVTTEDMQPKKKAVSSQGHKSAQNEKAFGGFKKGFLMNSKPKKETSNPMSKPIKKDADIPVIKPRNPKQKGMEIQEVQEAMKSSGEPSLEDKDWVTEDLLKIVQHEPALLNRLMDPKFRAALEQVETDPVKALSMLQKDPEMQKVMQEFGGLIGDYFTALGDSYAKAKVNGAQGSDIGMTERSRTSQQTAVPPSPEDEAKMRDILSDPEVMEVLQDHQIQRLLPMMKNNPEAAQLEVNKATPEMRAKLQKLVEVGLLGFAQ